MSELGAEVSLAKSVKNNRPVIRCVTGNGRSHHGGRVQKLPVEKARDMNLVQGHLRRCDPRKQQSCRQR
jgi:hypothetical protein